MWIDGDGPFALIAPCRDLSVSLWQTREDAEQSKAGIDRSGCGGGCYVPGAKLPPAETPHQIIDLRERRRANPRIRSESEVRAIAERRWNAMMDAARAAGLAFPGLSLGDQLRFYEEAQRLIGDQP